MFKKLGLIFVGVCAVSSMALQGWTYLDRTPTFSYEEAIKEVVTVQIDKIMDSNNAGGTGIGTGFFISNEGYIVTNYHVIDDAADIWVMTSDRVAHKAELIGEDRFADIAVLKIDPVGEIEVATWGNSDTVDYGDPVIGLGSPNGLFWSFTKGVVSDPKRIAGNVLFPLIQSDASINHGNSGGPLYNEEGKVIGINESIISSSESSGSIGISFSLPSNNIKHIVNKILKGEKIKHARIGIGIETFTEETSTMEKAAGVNVTAIDPEGPSAKTDLKVGDIITFVNDSQVFEYYQFQHIVMNMEPGNVVHLKVKRGDQELEIPVTLTEATHPSLRKEKDKKEERE